MHNIFKVFSGAFGFVYYYRFVFAKSLCVPFSILLALTVLAISTDLNSFWSLVWGIAYYLIHTIFAVTTHRVILLGATAVPEWGLKKISWREVRFIFYSIGIGFLLIPPALLVFIPVVGWSLALVAVCYVFGRLSLVFPAIATDQSWGFQDSWVQTQDHQLMMAVTVVIFPIIITLPETLLASIPYTEIPLMLLSSISTVIVVAALSVAFKIVRNES